MTFPDDFGSRSPVKCSDNISDEKCHLDLSTRLHPRLKDQPYDLAYHGILSMYKITAHNRGGDLLLCDIAQLTSPCVKCLTKTLP